MKNTENQEKENDDKEKSWHARMNELERLWAARMTETRLEYLDNFIRVTKKQAGYEHTSK